MSDGLGDLAAALRAEGGLLAGAVLAHPGGDPLPAGPREEVRLLLEAIREGELLHFGAPRIVSGEDPDLALLAGDRLYALGLERLAALGDLDAVAALADLITLCATAHAEGRPQDAGAAWEAALTRVHGASSAQPGAGAAGQTVAQPYSREQ